MITGDYPATARTIAVEAGLLDPAAPADSVLAGDELARLDEAALRARVRTTTVFARVMPEQKLRIVEALKANGEVVGMTGDGVNDAPSLKASHIGIAMGGRGTDVAREAAASAPGARIGTTGRGIGPAYEDKVGRRAIRVCDLANEDDLKVKIDRLRSHHDPLRAGLGLEPIDPEALLAQLQQQFVAAQTDRVSLSSARAKPLMTP